MKIKKYSVIKALAISTLVLIGSLNTIVAKANFTMSTANDDKRYTFELKPGETGEDVVFVTNRAEEPAIFTLYGADGINTAEGNFTIKTAQQSQSSVGTWIQFERKQIELQPGVQTKIPFKVIVPESAPPGTYGGGIAISFQTASDAEKEKLAEQNTNGGNSMGYKVTSRRIITMVVTIPGTRKHSFAWDLFGYRLNNQNKHAFDFNFENTGNTMLIVDGELEIYGGLDGNTIDEKKEGNINTLKDVTIFQGETLNIEEIWQKQPLIGKFSAVARLTFWEYDIVTGTKKSAQVITKTVNFSVFPWFHFISLILLLALIAGIIIFAKISHGKLIASCKYYEIKTGDTIEIVAKKSGMEWHKLAKLNGLKAPFGLTKGQKLLLPPKNFTQINKK